MEETLTPDDAVDLTRDLLPTGVSSHALGLKLGLPKAVIDDIHRTFSEPQDGLFHVLVESTSQPACRLTWKGFADALRSCEVNLPTLADRVEATNIKGVGEYSIAVVNGECQALGYLFGILLICSKCILHTLGLSLPPCPHGYIHKYISYIPDIY